MVPHTTLLEISCCGSNVVGPRPQENLSLGFSKRSYPNQPAQLQRLPRKFEISLVASLDMLLFNKRITNALIRLHGCAGWSALLLFAIPEDRFSRVNAHLMSNHFIYCDVLLQVLDKLTMLKDTQLLFI